MVELTEKVYQITERKKETDTSVSAVPISLHRVGMRYTPLTKKALRICYQAHKDQWDKGNMPYIFHPFHLAEQMETEEEICAALLHDVVEDSEYTLDDLEQEGFPASVLEALSLMTHEDGIPYMEYVCGLRSNAIARKVKLADLAHNSDQARLEKVTLGDLSRQRKYHIAQAILADDAYDEDRGCFCKHIPLDEIHCCQLSVFYRQSEGVLKYNLDAEDGSNVHYEFNAADGERLRYALDPKRSLPEALAEYLNVHNIEDLQTYLSE